MSDTNGRSDYGTVEFTSEGVVTVAFDESTPGVVYTRNPPMTAETLLVSMRARVRHYGSPLPDGYVPPPGIDLDALLKQVPWPPQ